MEFAGFEPLWLHKNVLREKPLFIRQDKVRSKLLQKCTKFYQNYIHSVCVYKIVFIGGFVYKCQGKTILGFHKYNGYPIRVILIARFIKHVLKIPGPISLIDNDRKNVTQQLETNRTLFLFTTYQIRLGRIGIALKYIIIVYYSNFLQNAFIIYY